MIYLKLFLTFVKIGIFSFGGGYAMLPLIRQEVVLKNAWLTNNEFIEIIAISQVTPGPIAINSATYVGYVATKSILGSICTTVGVILPSVVIMSLLIYFISRFKNSKYVERAFKGLKYIVIGLVLAAGLSLLNRENFIDYLSPLIFLGTIIASLKFKAGPILVTLISGIIGIIIYM